MKRRALVAIANGSEELEAVAIIDTLRRAGIDVTVASVESDKLVRTSRRVRIEADELLADCKGRQFDLIILPGGLPGAEHLRDCEQLTDMLKNQAASGMLYAAICASPAVILAAHGLLDGKKATCYPGLEDKLPDKSAASQRVVVDGNCVTSQGPGTAMEFSLKLIELMLGAEKAAEIGNQMLVR